VYYTDDGGTSAVEVAIKMGFRTYQQRMKVSQNDIEQTYWIVAAQEGCYHGDTLGAMNIMESYVSTEHPWYQERSLCLSTPTIGYQDGMLSITLPHGMTTSDDVTYTFDSIPDVMDIHVRSLSPKLLSLYKEIIEMQWLAHEHRTQQKIGCAILEPLLQCASGMKFVDPLWQAAMVDVAQSRNIPVIFDESTTGMYRLGIRSASQILLRNPDIVIHSKLLTGGIVPLSAIVTNKSVYDACVDVEFLYGNTLVANPISCASALYALSMYDTYQKQRVDVYTGRTIKHSSQPYLLFDEDRVRQLSLLPSVKQSFTLGSILTITLHSNNDDNPNDIEANDIALQLVQSLLDRQSILLGLNQVNYTSDVVYIMVPPFTSRDVCNRITDIVYRAIQELQL
jgi:dethiobiotin synthetase/adenosylmethionine--8-amino-7-oxononanoate aminotransferase